MVVVMIRWATILLVMMMWRSIVVVAIIFVVENRSGKCGSAYHHHGFAWIMFVSAAVGVVTGTAGAQTQQYNSGRGHEEHAWEDFDSGKDLHGVLHMDLVVLLR